MNVFQRLGFETHNDGSLKNARKSDVLASMGWVSDSQIHYSSWVASQGYDCMCPFSAEKGEIKLFLSAAGDGEAYVQYGAFDGEPLVLEEVYTPETMIQAFADVEQKVSEALEVLREMHDYVETSQVHYDSRLHYDGGWFFNDEPCTLYPLELIGGGRYQLIDVDEG